MSRKWVSYIRIVLLIVVCIFIDQWTKYLAAFHLKGKTDIILIKNVLRLHYLDGGNTGAAWGIFSGKIILFILFTFVAIFFLSVFLTNIERLILRKESEHINALRILSYMISLLMAGAIGNLIDRMVHGYVIDFIYFELINFPIFNVADCYVTVSCIVMILICLFQVNEKDFNRIFSLKLLKKKKK